MISQRGGKRATLRLSAVTHGHQRVTADTGVRLSRYLGTSEAFWTDLQDDHDREIAKDQLGATLEVIHPITG